MIYCRAIRGATTVENNDEKLILLETKTLLNELISQNSLESNQIISIFFTVTADLNKVFPAKAARQLGLNDTPLMCSQEIDVPNSLACCIRVLVHVNTTLSKQDLKHIYLKSAEALRPEFKD